MDEQTKQQRMERVRELLKVVRHVPIATVNEDGSPHLSPVFMALDWRLNGFWSSHPQTLHSQNIARSGQVFLTLFETQVGQGGGLYIQATATELSGDTEAFAHAYELFENTKRELGAPASPADKYAQPDGQRLYQLTPVKMWVNASEKDASGAIIRDQRYEIVLEDLELEGE